MVTEDSKQFNLWVRELKIDCDLRILMIRSHPLTDLNDNYFLSSVHMIVPVSKLKSHPKNQEIYSLSNIEDLENSISSLGLLEKLVIGEEFQVISGNRRLVAIQNLGWKKVECEKVTLPEDEVLTYIIHHNKQRIKTCREQLN